MHFAGMNSAYSGILSVLPNRLFVPNAPSLLTDDRYWYFNIQLPVDF